MEVEGQPATQSATEQILAAIARNEMAISGQNNLLRDLLIRFDNLERQVQLHRTSDTASHPGSSGEGDVPNGKFELPIGSGGDNAVTIALPPGEEEASQSLRQSQRRSHGPEGTNGRKSVAFLGDGQKNGSSRSLKSPLRRDSGSGKKRYLPRKSMLHGNAGGGGDANDPNRRKSHFAGGSLFIGSGGTADTMHFPEDDEDPCETSFGSRLLDERRSTVKTNGSSRLSTFTNPLGDAFSIQSGIEDQQHTLSNESSGRSTPNATTDSEDEAKKDDTAPRGRRRIQVTFTEGTEEVSTNAKAQHPGSPFGNLDPQVISKRKSFSNDPMNLSMSQNLSTNPKPKNLCGYVTNLLTKSIDPLSIGVGVLDVLYVITAVVSFVMLVTLYHPSSGPDPNEMTPSWFLTWSIIQVVFSSVFMAARFRIRCRRDARSWVLEDDLAMIRKTYMREWFFLDLLLTLPFEFCFLGWCNPVFHYASSKQFLRYIRCITLTKSSNPLTPQRSWYRFVLFCATIMLVAHVAASGFQSIMETPGLTYVDSLYWSVATMTSTGYTALTPSTDWQKLYSTLSMLAGVLMISTFTAFATQYLTQKDAIAQETDKHKTMMMALLKYYRVPWSVSKEVIAVFPSVLHNKLLTHFRSSIDALPPFLREVLTNHFNGQQLRAVPMFSTLPEQLLLQLASVAHAVFVATGDTVFEEGDPADALYVVLQGVVEVTKSIEGVNTVLATLRNGDCFGEMGLLNHNPRNATVQAAVSSELLVLEEADFEELLLVSDEFHDAIMRFAESRDMNFCIKGHIEVPAAGGEIDQDCNN